MNVSKELMASILKNCSEHNIREILILTEFKISGALDDPYDDLKKLFIESPLKLDID